MRNEEGGLEVKKGEQTVNPYKCKTSEAAYRPIIKSCVININMNSVSYLNHSQKITAVQRCSPADSFFTFYSFPYY